MKCLQNLQQDYREDNMNEFDEWDQVWNLTESGFALIEAIEKAKQDADV